VKHEHLEGGRHGLEPRRVLLLVVLMIMIIKAIDVWL
jgi:hypothetical protein